MQHNWWEKFISLESSESVDIKRKKLVLNTCSYIGGSIVLFFAIQSSFQTQPLLKISLFISALFLYGNVILSYWHKHMLLAITACGFGIIPLVFAIVYTGGYENTGLYWTYPFAITIFVFFGYFRGLIVNVFIFLVILWMLKNPDFILANYRAEEVSRFLASYVVNILFCLINEYFRSCSHAELAEINFDKQRQANSDPLTKLPNRRFVETVFLDNIDKERDDNFPMMLVSLDIDHFKKVNDNYGHDVGDKILQHLANLMKKHTRETDVVARIGGEEFLIIFPKTGFQLGVTIADKLRKMISESTYSYQNIEIVTTVSLGCVCVQCASDIDKGLKRADELLYQAKRAGRNRTESQAM
ncbi:MAG: GGDEF domain-containing protein [Thalassotalea sp.]